MNIFDSIAGRVADPEATAIETPGGARITHAGLIARSGRMANALASLGVAPGDRVAVQVEKSVEAIILYLAVVRAGAVFLPLNTAYTPAEVEYFLTDAEPRIFVCDPARAEALRPADEKAGARVLTLDAAGQGSLTEAAEGAAEDFATVPREDGDLAALLYTSGTTGRSKGAMLSHGNLASNALALVDAWHFTARDVLIHALPIFHTHGLFVATNVVLLSGGSMIFLPKFDQDRIFEAMGRATVLMGVPTFYVRLLGDARLDAGATRNMRLFISGSCCSGTPSTGISSARTWKPLSGCCWRRAIGCTASSLRDRPGPCAAGGPGSLQGRPTRRGPRSAAQSTRCGPSWNGARGSWGWSRRAS